MAPRVEGVDGLGSWGAKDALAFLWGQRSRDGERGPRWAYGGQGGGQAVRALGRE